MVALLRHDSPSVQQLVWTLLQSAVAAASEQDSSSSSGPVAGPGRGLSPVMHLLLLPDVLQCLVVEQLSSAASKPAACALLMGMLRCGSSSGGGGSGSCIARQLLPWRPWISSCAGDTPGDALNNTLTALLEQGSGPTATQGLADSCQPGQGLGQEPGQSGFWSKGGVSVLQDLFSVDGGVRRAAGRALLQLLTAGADLGPEEMEGITGMSVASLQYCFGVFCPAANQSCVAFESRSDIQRGCLDIRWDSATEACVDQL
jgi:hypothetical protein